MAKGLVATEDFIPAESRKRDLQSGLSGRPGNEIAVDAVHAWLVQRANCFIQARQHFVTAKHQLLMCRTELLCGAAGYGGFAELSLGKGHGESVHARNFSTRQRRQRSRIDSATQKHTDRN